MLSNTLKAFFGVVTLAATSSLYAQTGPIFSIDKELHGANIDYVAISTPTQMAIKVTNRDDVSVKCDFVRLNGLEPQTRKEQNIAPMGVKMMAIDLSRDYTKLKMKLICAKNTDPVSKDLWREADMPNRP